MCEGDTSRRDEANEFVYFTIPDSLGSSVTLAVGFTVGIYPEGEMTFELLFDDIFVADSAAEITEGIVEFGITDNELLNNYPNPFTNFTTINYSVPVRSDIELSVYNILGKEITTLVNETKEAGSYHVQFDGSNLNSDIYFYTLKMGDKKITRKMILVK